MAHNTFGSEYSVTTFGESHGPAIGCVIDGIEPGFPIDWDAVRRQMERRRPGANALGTKRNEADVVEVLSGVFEGRTTGTPLALLIRNGNQHSSDYENLKDLFRPGHADYTYWKKYGIRDWRGGGRSSARETAARLAAGAIARQVLESHGITIQAGTIQVGDIRAEKRNWDEAQANLLSCPDQEAASRMQALIEQMRRQEDSIGGIVECVISGVPSGLGDPEADKLEAKLGSAMLSINASKGVEFGDGFQAALHKGSEDNDQMDAHGFLTNHAGGMLGGISTGADIILRVAFKATPSISLPQKTVTIGGEETTLVIKGRHDPCVCPRAVPVVEGMAAITLLDCYYAQFGRGR